MKKFSLLLVSALVAFSISAQEVQNVSNGTVFLRNKGSDNWYMGLGGGTNMYLNKGINDQSPDFMDRLGWNGQIEIGRWNSPRWGARVVLEGGNIQLPSWGREEMNWVGGHLDLMYNVTQAWGGYRADRVYNLIPYLGIGYMYGLDKDWKKIPHASGDDFYRTPAQSFTYNVGLINNFQLSPRFAIFVDLGFRVLNQGGFDGQRHGGLFIDSAPIDGMFTANAGIKFGLGGKQTFTPAELMDYNLINDLNSQINRLRAENEELRRRPASCPDCPDVQPQVVQSSVHVPNVVFFRINSAVIDRGQQVSVFNTAEHMRANPNARVKIIAYADRGTGTPAINMALSERRARAVAAALQNHGIAANRIEVEWKGDTEQPYAENDWNRVAIFFMQ
jgi:outer membrane protein OmpA-like peptidoglycan-associated protein/uncharacterized protein YaiE (UPF0345 family)